MGTRAEEPASAPTYRSDSPVEKLRRWEELGAVWRIASRTSSHLTVSLLSCDGGEEIDTVFSDDPRLFGFVAGRSASDE